MTKEEIEFILTIVRFLLLRFLVTTSSGGNVSKNPVSFKVLFLTEDGVYDSSGMYNIPGLASPADLEKMKINFKS